jgi:hypothetical protein
VEPVQHRWAYPQGARRRWPADGQHRPEQVILDHPAVTASGAASARGVHGQLRPFARAWVNTPTSRFMRGAVLPLRRGAAQLRSQRYFTGGDLRRNLRRVPRCPRQWDLWIHLFQGELFTMPAGAMGTCWLVHVDGLTFACGRGGTIFTHPAKWRPTTPNRTRGGSIFATMAPGSRLAPARCSVIVWTNFVILPLFF